jgi:hypothetical protein
MHGSESVYPQKEKHYDHDDNKYFYYHYEDMNCKNNKNCSSSCNAHISAHVC